MGQKTIASTDALEQYKDAEIYSMNPWSWSELLTG